jgi:hypothetical protein
MLEARVRSVGASEERLDTLVVRDLRAVDLRLEHQALRVHEQVALLSLHLLAATLSSLFSHAGALDLLAIDYAGRGLRTLPVRTRARWRKAAGNLAQAQSMRQVLK